MIFGSPEEQAQKQRTKAYEANKRGNRSYEQGDWANAVSAYREALQQAPDDPVIRQNLQNAEAKLRERQDKEATTRAAEAERQQRDAASRAAIQPGINRLIATLQTQRSSVDFDGTSRGSTPGLGLEFMSLGGSMKSTKGAPAPAAVPAVAAPAVVVDAAVVDLRDAKTLTVDPAKVKGPPPPATTSPSSQSLYRMTEEDLAFLSEEFKELKDPEFEQTVLELLQADDRGDAQGIDQAFEHLAKWWGPLDQARSEQSHQQVMADIRTLEASDPDIQQALRAARIRVRQQEVAALEKADLQWRQEGTKLQEQFLQSGAESGEGSPTEQAFDKGVEARNERLRKAQVAALRQAYADLENEVSRLKKQVTPAP